VQEGFPRITERSVPDGVGHVRYRLSLDACTQWRIGTDELASHLHETGQS
jgi:hypothetical protein